MLPIGQCLLSNHHREQLSRILPFGFLSEGLLKPECPAAVTPTAVGSRSSDVVRRYAIIQRFYIKDHSH